VRSDLGDLALVDSLPAQNRPRSVQHFAAESYVDRSIHVPEDFIQTNIVGSLRLQESVPAYLSALPEAEQATLGFLRVRPMRSTVLWLRTTRRLRKLKPMTPAAPLGPARPRLLDELRPKVEGTSYATQITHITDRLPHDRRHEIDARKIERELGWKPA
jgi:dTDP-D-glucose 4,6-dehydratase